MFDWSYFSEKFSDIVKLYENTSQDKEWHGEGNVAIHTKMVLKSLHSDNEFKLLSERDKFIVSYAAFFHDYGKPFTTKEEKGRIVSPGHSKRGSLMFREKFFEVLAFEDREAIAMLIRYHGYPAHYYEKKEIDIVRIAEILDTRLLYLLSTADFKGRIAKDKVDFLYQVDYFKEMALKYECYGERKKWSNIDQREFFFNKGYDFIPYPKKRGIVYMLSGLPGVGKDYFVSQKKLPVVSFDDIRRKNKVKKGDKKGEGRVIQEAKSLMKKYLANKQDFIFNGTNLNKENRQKWINLFKKYDSIVEIIYIEKPIGVILRQNQNREFSVPLEIIFNYLKRMEVPTRDECDKIIYNVKKEKVYRPYKE